MAFMHSSGGMYGSVGGGTVGRPQREPELLAGDPIVGWRCWRVDVDDDGFWLTSTWQPNGKVPHVRWPHREALKAACVLPEGPHCGMVVPSPVEEHEAPHVEHYCGVYALKDEAMMSRWSSGWVEATGQVSMWGHVIVCEDGYRAQYAYPKTVTLMEGTSNQGEPARFDVDGAYPLEEIAAELSVAYGVPVDVRWRDDA